MKHLLLVLLFSFSTALINAQTYFYIDEIAVQPTGPTSQDVISIDLIGGLSSTGAFVASASAMVSDQTVTISITAQDPGGGAAIVPHTETVALGMLTPGTYTVVINGVAVADLAPTPQHMFTVSGAGNSCDYLTINSVQWHSFTDTAIVVHVTNVGSGIFSYPNFILFDVNGDTLAFETTNFNGLATESWHILRVLDDATIPSSPFMGSLELWTGFTTDLACSWDLSIDLCPPPPCASVLLQLQNVGGGLTVGTFSWTLYDEDLLEIQNGSFEMTNEIQFDTDTVCLEPGYYSMTVVPDQDPTGGQPYYGVITNGYISGPGAPVTWGLPVLLDFEFLTPCVSGSNAIHEPLMTSGLVVTMDQDAIVITNTVGNALGTVELFDVQGRLLFRASSASNSTVIPLSADLSGSLMIRAGGQTLRTVVLPR